MQKKSLHSSEISIFTLGLAVFSMLFGAGNIIFPIKAGVMAGSNNFFAISGFLLTGALLPAIGLVAMILFNGDFKAFFNRLGKIPGFIAVLFCMIIIGPFIAMPRCISLPYDMIKMFLPAALTLPRFTLTFCLITFLLTYKESRLLEILGKIIGPLKIASLSFIAILGLWYPQTTITPTASDLSLFTTWFIEGFQTLDLLGTLFFGYIILRILHTSKSNLSSKQLAFIGLKGGLIGSLLLAIVYIAFSYLGAFYGKLVDPSVNGAEMFKVITLHVVGKYGALAIIVATMLACLSTMAALATVFSQYLHDEILCKKVPYIQCLASTLCITAIIANFGLTNILTYSAPFINVGYPIIIVTVACNLAYKLCGFSWIKLPVALTTIGMIVLQLYPYVIG